VKAVKSKDPTCSHVVKYLRSFQANGNFIVMEYSSGSCSSCRYLACTDSSVIATSSLVVAPCKIFRTRSGMRGRTESSRLCRLPLLRHLLRKRKLSKLLRHFIANSSKFLPNSSKFVDPRRERLLYKPAQEKYI
jgi:hypothetical protein